jgi:hypothetical protein
MKRCGLLNIDYKAFFLRGVYVSADRTAVNSLESADLTKNATRR